MVWLYSTGPGIPIRRSVDLVHWDTAGRVLASAVPDWATAAVPGVQFPWAPDISLFDGRYHLYYSLSTFGSQRSVIALATNAALDPADARYRWTDEGEVLASSPGASSFNAIDPNVAFDELGRPWLAWGSFWGGIKLHRLDAATGKLSLTDTATWSLAARAGIGATSGPTDAQAIEAPFIVHHGAYFYLFASFDLCCRGSSSTYNVRVGRATTITGPYVDATGVAMTDGGGPIVLQGLGRVRGQGHCAVISDAKGDYMLHHFYDDLAGGTPTLQVRPITWTADGWPVVGEPLAPPPSS
ncbi:MAG: arabinan endo-1,5-alpha-L-arabinosidase [Gemmatimonadaceae bacterium]|nr:arabinan endo-1,5-alpha-L-arabinosidase [Gemmatimonadaceae bacterium]